MNDIRISRLKVASFIFGTKKNTTYFVVVIVSLIMQSYSGSVVAERRSADRFLGGILKRKDEIDDEIIERWIDDVFIPNIHPSRLFTLRWGKPQNDALERKVVDSMMRSSFVSERRCNRCASRYSSSTTLGRYDCFTHWGYLSTAFAGYSTRIVDGRSTGRLTWTCCGRSAEERGCKRSMHGEISPGSETTSSRTVDAYARVSLDHFVVYENTRDKSLKRALSFFSRYSKNEWKNVELHVEYVERNVFMRDIERSSLSKSIKEDFIPIPNAILFKNRENDGNDDDFNANERTEFVYISLSRSVFRFPKIVDDMSVESDMSTQMTSHHIG